MYIPRHFAETDYRRILALLQAYPFATLVTTDNEQPVASHLPLLIEDGNPMRLHGHMAYANEQWRHLRDRGSVMVIFQGPHGYISPRWYNTAGVPTWNYAAVHVYGKAKIVDQSADLKMIVDRLSQVYEQHAESPWQPDYPDKMLSAIVGFVIEAQDIQAKYKLSQNRSRDDAQGVIRHLREAGTQQEHDLADLMEAHPKKPFI